MYFYSTANAGWYRVITKYLAKESCIAMCFADKLMVECVCIPKVQKCLVAQKWQGQEFRKQISVLLWVPRLVSAELVVPLIAVVEPTDIGRRHCLAHS